MKPSPEQVREWAKKAGAKFDPHWGIAYNTGTATFERFAELAAQWGAEQAQHEAENAPWLTTAHMICTDAGIAHGPISGRLEALRDNLADKAQQPPVEEPELPEAAKCEGGWGEPCVYYYTAAQMQAHYQAGVRAGMAQSQDAKRLDWVESQGNGSGWLARNSITNRGYRIHNDKDAKHKTVREAIDSAMQKGQK